MNPRRGAPKPPPHIWAELEAAGATHDRARFDIARSAYHAWLVDNGHEHPQGRPAQADKAAR